MAEFNFTEYLRNNPLHGKSNTSTKLITESYQDKLEDILSDYGADTEIKSYIDSVNRDRQPDNYADFEDDDFLEDFQNYVADKSLEEVASPTKMKKSELKAKIKESILSTLKEGEDIDLEAELMADLNEAKDDKEDEEEVEVEDEVEIEDDVEMEEPEAEPSGGLTDNEMQIQNSLKIAYDNAISMGDQKLADQIGNSITFFTRTHVVER